MLDDLLNPDNFLNDPNPFSDFMIGLAAMDMIEEDSKNNNSCDNSEYKEWYE